MFDGCNCSSFTGFKPETRTGLHVVDLCVYIQWVIREWSKEMRWRKVDVKKGQRFVPHQNLQLSCSWRPLSMMSHAYVIAVQGPNRKKWCQNIIKFNTFSRLVCYNSLCLHFNLHVIPFLQLSEVFSSHHAYPFSLWWPNGWTSASNSVNVALRWVIRRRWCIIIFSWDPWLIYFNLLKNLSQTSIFV